MDDMQAATLNDQPADTDQDQPTSLFDRIKARVQTNPQLKDQLSGAADRENKTLDTYIEDHQDELSSKVNPPSPKLASAPVSASPADHAAAEQPAVGSPGPLQQAVAAAVPKKPSAPAADSKPPRPGAQTNQAGGAPPAAGNPPDLGNPPKSPDDLRSQVDAYSKGLDKETGKVRGEVDKKLTALDSLAAQYQAAYKEGMTKAQWGEAAEKLGHAFAMIGAGTSGLKSGVDFSSGLKFDKTDWSSRYKDLLDELKVNLQDIRTRAGEAKEEGRERIGSAEKQAELGARGAETQAQIAAREREATEQRRTQEKVARIGAESRESVAGTRAGASVESANIRAGATLGAAATRAAKSGRADKNDPGSVAMNDLQTAATLYEQGKTKEADALWNKSAGKARDYLKRTGGDPSVVDTALKQAQDRGVLGFGGTEAGTAGKTLGGGNSSIPTGQTAAPSKPGGLPPPAAGMVRMMDPNGKPHDVPAANKQRALDGGWTEG